MNALISSKIFLYFFLFARVLHFQLRCEVFSVEFLLEYLMILFVALQVPKTLTRKLFAVFHAAAFSIFVRLDWSEVVVGI